MDILNLDVTDEAEISPIQIVVEPTDVEKPVKKITGRIFIYNLISFILSAMLHLVVVSAFLLVYFEVIENSPGQSFFAGRGDIGQPMEFTKIEGLDKGLELEEALIPANEATTNSSEIPVTTPEVTLRPATSLPDMSGQLEMPEAKLSMQAMVARQWSASALSSRAPGMKEKLIKSEGGTTESEKSVSRGLEWLSKHQKEDGSWSMSPGSVCGNLECGRVQIESFEAATGLAILPFLAAGHIPDEPGPYEKVLKKGLEWLESRVDKNGRVMPDDAPTHYHMYAHAIVTITLCEASALQPKGSWIPAAKRAAQYIVSAQNRQDGGWRYAPGQAGDTSVYGWQVMALRSARVSGLNIPKSTMTMSRRWLTAAQTSRDGSTYAYMPMRPASPVMTAEALLCRQLFGDGPKDRGMSKGIQLVFEEVQRSMEVRNYYYWYYATQLIHNSGGKMWMKWNPIIRERLIKEQVVGGHASGSWQSLEPSMDRWGRVAGPMMQTSLGLLTLDVYYRHLPLYQVVESGNSVKGMKEAK